MFSHEGRSLAGWRPVLDIAESLFSRPACATLRGGVLYQRQMPETDPNTRGSIDLRAGTSVAWNAPDDELDHHHEVRRTERLAPAWRSLLPSAIDLGGWADAECTIELQRGLVTGVVSQENDEETDSALSIVHELVDGIWIPRIEISWTSDETDSDLLAMTADDIVERAERSGWWLHSARPIGHRIRDHCLVATFPTDILMRIDQPPR